MPGRKRKSRYEPDPGGKRSVTPRMVPALLKLAEFRFLSTPQLVRILDPKVKWPEKSVARAMRPLLDWEYVKVAAVPRSAVDSVSANGPSLLFGSAPNVYSLTKEGGKALVTGGYLEEAPPPGPDYGPRNALFLAHELKVRDAYCWALESTRRYGMKAPAFAWEALKFRAVSPDGLIMLKFAVEVLAAFLEIDRGTERGQERWAAKCRGYADLFASSDLARAAPASKRCVLVLCPDDRRCDSLSALVKELAPETWHRFWFAPMGLLDGDDFGTWLNRGEARELLP